MVGIVLISHSSALAQEACRLALQAAPGARVVGVGGVGDNSGEFGTDAVAIMEAIQQVYSDEGVLLLMDMGSALLSAETALEFLDEEHSARVALCSAPFVEGGVIAAVQAKTGANLATVRMEALGALTPKREQVGDILNPVDSFGEAPIVEIPDSAEQRSFTITNPHGLHARPAAVLVQTIARFDVSVFVETDGSPTPVEGSSINAVMKLNIRQGAKMHLHVWGAESGQFLREMEQLVLTEFGERSEAASTDSASPLYTPEETILEEIPVFSSEPVPASPGIAIGVSWLCQLPDNPIFRVTSGDRSDIDLLDQLLCSALTNLQKDIEAHQDDSTRDILEMHLVLMKDPQLVQRTKEAITKRNHSAEYAWWNTCLQVAEEYRGLEANELLNERGSDLIDIGLRVLRESSRVTLPEIGDTPPDEAVMFISDITPDLISRLDLNKIRGIVTGLGGSTSHAAIIARSKGLPMVCGYREVESPGSGIPVILNGNTGEVIVDPDVECIDLYRKRIAESATLKSASIALASEPAQTRDGSRIVCSANVGSGEECGSLLEQGADGIGLFRSEFLFLNRQQPPGEEEQYNAYRHAAEAMPNGSVVIRLLDIGGDKQISYIPLPKEENPFLGMRGVRVLLKYDSLLKTQLRAIARAAIHGRIEIMIPMVVDKLEVIQIRAALQGVMEELSTEGVEHAGFIPVGVMIETPSSVVLADELARVSEFFSVGTNDLVQYTLAAERNNIALANLYDPCHPSVLRGLRRLGEVAVRSGIPLSVCGEAASDPEMIPLLVGLGVDKLSTSVNRIPIVKSVVRSLAVEECRALVQEVWEFDSARDMRSKVTGRFPIVDSLRFI